MGIINVTPDSFSDGGLYVELDAAEAAARLMLAEGAGIVDVGGESTRPGAEPVSLDEELGRVIPLIERLSGLPISVDTAKSGVARRAIESGAAMVNDVTALRGDPELVEVVAETGVDVCLMHMQGEPRTMQEAPRYEDVVSNVVSFLEERIAFAVSRGVREERILVDPGFGFGKTPDQNLVLVRELGRIAALGRPVVVGLSRKSTLAKLLSHDAGLIGTDATSVGAAIAAFDRGASVFRVHDVRSHVEALAAAAAVEVGRMPG